MIVDPITEEIRAIRHELAAQFDNDVSRIFADVRERQATDGRVYVTLPKRPVRPLRGAEDTGSQNAKSQSMLSEILDPVVGDKS